MVCKRPGNCSTNSNSAALLCSKNGLRKPKQTRGAWCRALRTQFCRARRFYDWQTRLLRRNCSAILRIPLATIDIKSADAPVVEWTILDRRDQTLPGEFSVVATCCERRRFSRLFRPRSGGGANCKEQISHSGTPS